MLSRSLLTAGSVLAALVAATASAADETITYTYDAQGRVIAVIHSGTVNDGVTTTYAYDDADNRTAKSTTGAVMAAAVDALKPNEPAAPTEPPTEPAAAEMGVQAD